MEMDVEMETEEAEEESSRSRSPSFSAIKRLGVKNTIQTNFGDDYVFQIASSQEISTLAVSLSTNAIKFYSPGTGQYFGECKGHSGTINEISFSVPSSAHVISSCSSDGTIRVWDTRTFKQVSLLRAAPSREIFSFCFGGSTCNLLAAGCNTEIHFWDWRNGKQVSCLEDSHVDDVTQVMNVGTSIAKVGFFGETNKKLWCLTHIETLSLWDWKDARKESDFQDARSLASDSWNLDHVDYFVDCYYSGVDDQMWVIGGTNAGTLGYFPVDYKGPGAIRSPEAILEGGHGGVVRTVLPVSGTHIGATRKQGIFGWTGGEDGRLCCWLSDESSEVNRSWISNALVMKSEKIHKKNRHHPY
ncbi:WD repeat-containing protein GTS1 isoform X2 [Magnolia sinica]|uniref:WD repeat-containing protein GTS1 isoform X2 n=1 Tax=Magnolia sinica TaxID=86752 RepID=UPI002659DE7E|nr:WD repeat-containing protein GTS1 isoform X2 [Magnolia sinica]